MDIERPDIAQAIRRRRFLWIVTVMVLVCGASIAVSRLEPAAPSVEENTVVSGVVKRGEFYRQVRGSGTLVAEEILWVTTRSSGRVEAIRVLPGAEVKADTVLIELSNPELTQEVLNLELDFKAAEAGFEQSRLEIEKNQLELEATVAEMKEQLTDAEFEAENYEDMAAEGFVSDYMKRKARAAADTLKKRYDIAVEKLAINEKLVAAQIVAKEADIAKLRGQLELKRQLLASLQIRAGIDGILQKLGDSNSTTIQVGQQVGAGNNVARVADQTRLKAEIKVPETQAKDVQLGQSVSVDTRNGVIQGRVSRIDPAVVSGTVTVDVALEGSLPKGARPDLSVDGTIELETVADVLYVGRPVQGQAESDSSIFKLTEDGKEAVRVPVKLGRNSVNYIEVREGLSAGDRIILSDMSQWDAYDRVRLK